MAHTALGQRRQQIHHQLATSEAEAQDSTHARPSKRLRLDGFLSVADLAQWETTAYSSSTRQPRLLSGLPGLDALVGDRMDAKNEEFPPLTTKDGLAWGDMLHLAGPPASGKTQLALQWTATAVGVRTTYLAGAAGPSLTTLAQRLAALTPQHRLADITLDSFGNESELALALAAVEEACVQHPHAPWLLVVDGMGNVTGSRSDQSRLRRRLARLARLYHGIGIVVGGRANSMALGTVQLRLSPPVVGVARLHGRLEEHPRSAKVGQTIQLIVTATGVEES
jgi:hypothetical protein